MGSPPAGIGRSYARAPGGRVADSASIGRKASDADRARRISAPRVSNATGRIPPIPAPLRRPAAEIRAATHGRASHAAGRKGGREMTGAETELHRLDSDVVAEPLVRSWYAWPYLISPPQAAMNLTRLHLPLLESFLEAPELHRRAAAQRRLAGGRFLAYAGPVDDVRRLRDETVRRTAPLRELAAAIVALESLLADRAKGESLEPLYAELAAPLRGRVELVYSLAGHPRARFLERLFYRTELDDVGGQSLELRRLAGDERAFSLATPRLGDREVFTFARPFRSPEVDDLFALRHTPRPLGEIAERLALGAEEALGLRALLAPAGAAPRPAPPAQGVRVRCFGHASVLVETEDVRVFFDPTFSHASPGGLARFDVRDLPPRIDYAVVTHDHQDHFMLEALLELRGRVGTWVVPRSGQGFIEDPSLPLLLRELGFQNVVALDEFDELELPGGRLLALPFLGEHADLDIRSRLVYRLDVGGRALLVGADARCAEPALYRALGREYGAVDLLLLGMECEGAPMSWLYGPLTSRRIARAEDQSRRLNGSDCARAWELAQAVGARRILVYAMGLEPWLQHVMGLAYDDGSRPILESDALVRKARERGVPCERLLGKAEIAFPDRRGAEARQVA
jgi:L-ascorbate metabolism protein UlaG (beta-lactamase superfamily)